MPTNSPLQGQSILHQGQPPTVPQGSPGSPSLLSLLSLPWSPVARGVHQDAKRLRSLRVEPSSRVKCGGTFLATFEIEKGAERDGRPSSLPCSYVLCSVLFQTLCKPSSSPCQRWCTERGKKRQQKHGTETPPQKNASAIDMRRNLHHSAAFFAAELRATAELASSHSRKTHTLAIPEGTPRDVGLNQKRSRWIVSLKQRPVVCRLHASKAARCSVLLLDLVTTWSCG